MTGATRPDAMKGQPDKVLGLAVFLLQAALAILFFFSLGSSTLDAALLAALGAVLEIVKRISWRAWRGGRSARSLVLGLTLAAVSATAAIGFSFSAINRTMDAQARDMQARAVLSSSLAALDAEAAQLTAKAAALPAEWVTSSLRYSARLGKSRPSAPSSPTASPPRRLLPGRVTSSPCFRLGLDYRRLVLALLLVVALALELAVFDLTPGAQRAANASARAERYRATTGAFFAWLRPPLGLLSRATPCLAARANVSAWQARQAFDRLTAAGMITTVHGRHYAMKAKAAAPIASAINQPLQMEERT